MTNVGKVYLVGAGPGDPGLLTVKGMCCLAEAEFVLYDGLVNPLLLRYTTADIERTARVKTSSGRVLPQEEINRRLIEAAKSGKTVVRLKGGDPFVFGRGSEEAAALAAEGIPFEVVPGITASTAAGAYAGFSVTHRDTASGVLFVTGHENPNKENATLDYAVLANFSGTLVFYMGLNRLDAIANELIQHGKLSTTPVSVVSRATTPFQRVVTGELSEIAAKVQAAELSAPSLIFVGECVLQREQISWFEQRPLFGKRIGILRAESQVESVISQTLQLGAQPVLLPMIEILPPDDWSAVDAVLQRLEQFDWLVFTSVNGVTGLLDRLWETGGDVRRLSSLKLAAIGPATAAALERYCLRADLVPDEYRAEALAAALKPFVSASTTNQQTGQRVLWARANRGRDLLPQELTAAGATVEELVVYRNCDIDALSAENIRLLEQGDVDWICLSSPSIARNFARLLPKTVAAQIGKTIRLASISPVTTTAAENAGLQISTEAVSATWDGLFAAIRAVETSIASEKFDSSTEIG